MALLDALREVLDLAAQGVLTPYHLRDTLGGRVRAVTGTPSAQVVVIAYSDWELHLEAGREGVVVYMRHTLTPALKVNVARFFYDGATFRNLLFAAYEAMTEEEE